MISKDENIGVADETTAPNKSKDGWPRYRWDGYLEDITY